MDFQESQDHALLRETVRRIAASYGHAYYVEKARCGGKTRELWRDVARAGLVGVSLPEAYGGGGLGILELAVVCEELAAQGCPLLLLAVSPAICGSILARSGTEEQKSRWLPGIASGETRMAFAITEPDAGSNSHKLSTTATREGECYRLRGAKHFISFIDECETVLVVAKSGVDARSGRGRLSLFVVDTDAPGLTRALIPVEIVAPEKQYALYFDDVRVPADRLVGGEGDGLKQVFAGLNPERITGAAIGNGLGLYALAKAARYARERNVWGVPIGAHQGLAHPLAKAKIEVELARLMTWRAAWLYDRGDQAAAEAANMAKYAAAEAALGALDQAIQTHGGNGLASEFGLADLWFGLRLLRTAPVSREMILNFVAEHSLGLPRSYGA
jgi:alkylation response protein AidB-like acyl-CoA dehydrogenase